MDITDHAASEESPSSDSATDSDDSTPVETLVAGRDKRATAGNRLANLIEREEDDDVALLFAELEDEEDIEFQGDEEDDASDAHLDSSSDEDDQGPNAKADDDLEGEHELERQAKVERAKKRKADMAFTTQSGLRKKVKTVPPSLHKAANSSAPPSNKKKERDSWLPNEAETVRASSRRQTMANRQITHARLKDNEVKTAKVREQLAKANKEREKQRPKEMTQADRLAEAEKTEKKNAKSLNRWEATEKKRAEEQAAKLMALHNRELEGPVVRWWSGLAEWQDGKLMKVGGEAVIHKTLTGHEPKKRGRKPKIDPNAIGSTKETAVDQFATSMPQEQTDTPAASETAPETAPKTAEVVRIPSAPEPELANPQITFTDPQGPENYLLKGIHEYASLPSDITPTVDATSQTPSSIAPENITDSTPQVTVQAQPPQPPAIVEYSSRNVVKLNFAAQDGVDLGLFTGTRKAAKPLKQNQEICAITSLPARYRDPVTGVPYANALGYKKLKDMLRHRFVWSSMLGCYVGSAEVIARGTPDGFLAPQKVRPTQPSAPI